MPKILELEYAGELGAANYILGVRDGEAVRFAVDLFTADSEPVINSLPAGGAAGQVLTKNSATDGDAGWGDVVSSFLALSDTPDSYATYPGKVVAVKSDSSGLEFVAASSGSYAIVDLSSATEDYALAPGEVAKIAYTSATSVPLHIKTVEGVYEIYITGDGSATASNNNGTYLNPNGTTYSSAFSRVGYYSLSTNTGGQGVSTESNFYTGAAGIALKSRMVANTTTKAKTIEFSAIGKRTSDLLNENGNIYWIDVTTVWASLGTITLPFAQSGTIIIKRIA